MFKWSSQELRLFLRANKSDFFDGREINLTAEIDYEISTFFAEPIHPTDFEVMHTGLGKNADEEGYAQIMKNYGVKNDPDIDIRIILERKTKYHKDMVKFYKSVQQTRARKLQDFLIEARNSSASEYASLCVNISNDYLLGNYNMFCLFLPTHQFRNIEDIYFSIWAMNDLIESERKALETEEVTPIVINEDIDEEDNLNTGISNILF
jgi:hypothetical protein